VTDLEAFRVALNSEQKDVKVTMLALMIKASVAALKSSPASTARSTAKKLVLKQYYTSASPPTRRTGSSSRSSTTPTRRASSISRATSATSRRRRATANSHRGHDRRDVHDLEPRRHRRDLFHAIINAPK